MKFFHPISKSPVLAVLAINIILAAAWGMSWVLASWGVSYLTIIFGFFALFGPGFCLTLLFEQLAESKTKPLEFLLWITIFSFVLTPAAIYGLSLLILHQSPVDHTILPFLIWWILCLILVLLVSQIKKQPSVLSRLAYNPKTNKELLWISVGFLLIMLINFTLYPLIPEGDGYSYLTKWRLIQADPKLLAAETRGLFLIFVNLCSDLLKVDPYWILKIFLPLSHFTLVISCYIFTKKFITDSRQRIILALSPFFFPVILQESLMGRPQSIVLVTFLASIVLISKTLDEKKNIRGIYWLLSLLVVSVVGAKIHALFGVIAIITAISIILHLRSYISKRPVDSVIVIIALGFLISPYIIQTRILSDAWGIIKLSITSIQHNNFVWWFIDHYKNVDGAEVGWPGKTAFFYYGYNLGLVFPICLAWFVFKKRANGFTRLFQERYWMIPFLFGLFFFIAEIAPRFELAYLPDRAWLFLAMLFALIMPIILASGNNLRITKTLVVLGILSIGAGSALTYTKQGWVTPEEVKAASFIKASIPENAVLLGQGSGQVMGRYYANRTFIRPTDPSIFLEGEKGAAIRYVEARRSPYNTTVEAVFDRKQNLSQQFVKFSQDLNNPNFTDLQTESLFINLQKIQLDKAQYFVDTSTLIDSQPLPDGPIYLIYNQNKFKSLYGGRSWWQASNFYGANIEKLNQNYSAIYNQDGIIIWEAKK